MAKTLIPFDRQTTILVKRLLEDVKSGMPLN